MADKSVERVFQDSIIQQLLAHGWLLGKAENYNRELALYPYWLRVSWDIYHPLIVS